IKLRDDANTTIARISDELAYLCLRVIQAIRSHFVQLGKTLALHTKAFVVGKVQMQDIHLYGCHAIDVALEHVHGNEVATDIDEQSARNEGWPTLHADARQGKSNLA